MKNELEYSLIKLEKALNKLEAGVETAKDELETDGVIQRFEFTFELLWKTLKIFLSEKGIIAKTPKDALQEAFRIGWIKEEDIFLNMLKDRNETSHIYDKETAEEIFKHIKTNYLITIKNTFKNLKNLIK